MSSSISGTTASDRGLRLGALLDRAAEIDAVARRQACVQLVDLGCERLDHRRRQHTGATSAWTVSVGTRSRRQIRGRSCP